MTTPIKIAVPIHVVRETEDNADNGLPKYETAGAAGFDIAANIKEPMLLLPGEAKAIPTGLYVAIPEGFELQIRPRSGLALKKSVTVLNTPGTIDSDYRGEIMVILINHGQAAFAVRNGERIAQGVLTRFYQADFRSVSLAALGETQRGAAGFGSTGLKS